jgi:hypothetical protein
VGQDSHRPGARHTGDQPGTVNHPATSHQVGPPDPGHMLDPEDDVKPRSPGRTVNEDHRATGLGGIPGRRGRERRGAATPGCPDDGQQAPRGAGCRRSVHGSRVLGHPTAVTRSSPPCGQWDNRPRGCGQRSTHRPPSPGIVADGLELPCGSSQADMRRPPLGGQRGPSGALAPGGRGQCAPAQPRRGANPFSGLEAGKANCPSETFFPPATRLKRIPARLRGPSLRTAHESDGCRPPRVNRAVRSAPHQPPELPRSRPASSPPRPAATTVPPPAESPRRMP